MIIPLHSTGKKELTVTFAKTTQATVPAAVTKFTNKTNTNNSRMLYSTLTKHTQPLKNPVLV
jgi:hypothetical protein